MRRGCGEGAERVRRGCGEGGREGAERAQTCCGRSVPITSRSSGGTGHGSSNTSPLAGWPSAWAATATWCAKNAPKETPISTKGAADSSGAAGSRRAISTRMSAAYLAASSASDASLSAARAPVPTCSCCSA